MDMPNIPKQGALVGFRVRFQPPDGAVEFGMYARSDREAPFVDQVVSDDGTPYNVDDLELFEILVSTHLIVQLTADSTTFPANLVVGGYYEHERIACIKCTNGSEKYVFLDEVHDWCFYDEDAEDSPHCGMLSALLPPQSTDVIGKFMEVRIHNNSGLFLGEIVRHDETDASRALVAIRFTHCNKQGPVILLHRIEEYTFLEESPHY